MLGEFVVVCLCDIWGLPQFSLIATMCTMLCLYINFKQDYLFTFHKILTFMLGFPKHTFRIEYFTKGLEAYNQCLTRPGQRLSMKIFKIFNGGQGLAPTEE